MTSNSPIESKICSSQEDALKIVKEWKNAGFSIGFTNGCFDILHKGHVCYLEEASNKVDRLILGLNSDKSVRKLEKSANRPLQNEESRLYVMAALSSISLAVLFDDFTPLELIKKLEPDTLFKGADYKIEDIVGYKEVKARGGKVLTIPLQKGFSTTAIEQKIIENTIQ